MECNSKEVGHQVLPSFLAAGQELCGCYFLMSRGRCVYVGQSINVIGRACTHQREATKEYDEVRFIEYIPRQLKIAEQYWINELKPIHNLEGIAKLKAGMRAAHKRRKSCRNSNTDKVSAIGLTSIAC